MWSKHSPHASISQRRQFRLSQLSRLSDDVRQFLFEEKFDTWLDLEPLKVWQEQLKLHTAWPEILPFEWTDLMSPDTLEDLKMHDISLTTVKNAIVTPCLPSLVINDVLRRPPTRCHIPQTEHKRRLKIQQEIATRAVELQINHLFSNAGPEASQHLLQDTPKSLEKINMTSIYLIGTGFLAEDMALLMRSYKKLLGGISEKAPRLRAAARMHRRLNYVQLPSIDASCFLSKDIILFTYKEYTYLLHTEALLELHNKLTELNSILTYAWFQSGASLPENHYTFVIQFLIIISGTVSKYAFYPETPKQNMGFVYLKCMEGLGVSEIIRRADAEKGWDNRLLQETLWESLRQDKLVMEYYLESSALGKLWESATITQIAEVLGLVKVCGHPSIEVERGVQELFDRTHAVLNIDPQAVERSIGWLLKDLCLNFFKKHRRLPSLSGDLTAQPRSIQHIWNMRHSILDPAGKQIWNRATIADWSQVMIGKNMEFDMLDNQLEYIKDKALGITKSKVLKLWTLGPGEKMSIGLWEERRALLNFLLTPNFSNEFLKYMSKYETEDPWSNAILEYMVIKLTPKELEEKPQGRMFGASPGNERMRRIYQESKMMKFLDQYVPEQMLTPGELSMIKKLYSFRSISKLYPHHVAIQVSFDFSKWNNNMRSESIDKQAKRIADPFFGTTIFGRTMEFYEHALVYYMDKTYKRKWQGQYGGIEGLNQPSWTYYFLGGLKDALSRVGAEYQLTVKGDDVRAVILVNKQRVDRTGIDGVRDEILNLLQELCNGMGWQLNPQESFVSLSVICTSKQYQVNDTWLPASAKKIMKIESLANLIFPTFEDLIANIYSTCHSACSQTTVALPCYLTATCTAARLIMREMYTVLRSNTQYLMLLLWPQILGGPGALPLQCYFIRGENDMLAIATSLFRYILMDGTLEEQKYASQILRQKIHPRPDKSLLLADPYAIPIAAPERPSSVLRRLLYESLKEVVVNKDIKKLMSPSAQQHKAGYKAVLLSMDPYCAKLATMLWEVSPFYLVDEVIGKFLQSSTVFALLSRDTKFTPRYLRGKAIKALKLVLDAANRRLLYWCGVLKGSEKFAEQLLGLDSTIWMRHDRCTTELTQMIRNTLWGTRIYGITYPSLSDQTLIFTTNDMLTQFPGQSFEGIHSVVELHHIHAIPQAGYQSHHYSAVPGIIPWLGSTTLPKLKIPDIPSSTQSSSLRKLMTLLTLLRASSHYSESFSTVTKSIALAYTNINLDHVLAMTPDVGMGHIAHRAKIASFSMSVMPNSRPNINQLVTVNNNYLRVVQQDSHDRSINYAARTFYLTVMSTFPLQSVENLSPMIPTHYKVLFHGSFDPDTSIYTLCPYCCAVLDDVPVVFRDMNMPDLTEYQQLTHVGLSESDNTVLRKNVQAAVKNKIATVLAHEHWDVNRPDHIRKATHTVINSLAIGFQDAFKLSSFHEFSYMPRGQLLEVLSLTLGLRDLSICTPSLNVLRAMPARDLYRAVLNAVLGWYLDWVCDGLFLEPQIPPLVSVLQPHRNPLSGLFESIAEAGALGKMIIGASQEGVLNSPLSFATGSQTDGHIALISFLEAHEHMIRQWANYGSRTYSIKLFVAMEDDDTIRRQIYKRACSVQMMMVRRINVSLPVGSVLSSVVRMYQRHAEYCQRHNIVGEEHVHYDVFKAHISDEDTPGHEERLRKLGMFYAIMSLDFMLELGDWDNEMNLADIRNGMEQFPILVLDLRAAANVVYIGDEIPPGHYIRKTLSQKYNAPALKFVLNSVNHFLEDQEPALLDGLQQGFDLAIDILRTHLPHYNIYQYNIMTIEDADRLLKLRGVDPIVSIEQIADILEEIQSEDDVIDAGLQPLKDSFYAACSYQQHGLRHRHELQGIERQIVIPYVIPDLDGMLEVLPSTRELDEMPIRFIDQSEISRSRGYGNAAVVRFAHICDDLRIHDVLEQHYERFGCVVIGDGTGSISRYMLERHEESQVYMVSLARSPSSPVPPRDAAVHELPYAFLADHPNLIQIVARLHYQAFYPGDITNDAVVRTLHHELRQSKIPVACVISDLEWGTNVSAQEYVKAVFQSVFVYLQYHIHGCAGIFKIRLRNDPEIAYLIYFICASSEHFHLCTSLSDRDNEQDIYIFVQSPLATFTRVSNVGDYLEGLVAPPMLPDLVAMIIVRLIEWRTRFIRFRAAGSPSIGRTIAVLENADKRHDLPLLTLQVLLRPFKMALDQNTYHHCRFLDSLAQSAYGDALQIFNSLRACTRVSRQGALVMRLANKDNRILAQGVTAYIQQVITSVNQHILGMVLSWHVQIMNGLWPQFMHAVVQETWVPLLGMHVNYPQHNLILKCINGYWFFGTPSLHINLNVLTIRAINKALRILAWYIRTCSPEVYRGMMHGHRQLDRLGFRTDRLCCDNSALQMWRVGGQEDWLQQVPPLLVNNRGDFVSYALSPDQELYLNEFVQFQHNNYQYGAQGMQNVERLTDLRPPFTSTYSRYNDIMQCQDINLQEVYARFDAHGAFFQRGGD